MCIWRRQWQPTPVLLPGKTHGWRSVVGYSPWGHKERTRLSDFTFTFHFHALEKEMATHSSVLAWRIPGTGEPGELPSMGSHRVGHDWHDSAAAAAAACYQVEVALIDRLSQRSDDYTQKEKRLRFDFPELPGVIRQAHRYPWLVIRQAHRYPWLGVRACTPTRTHVTTTTGTNCQSAAIPCQADAHWSFLRVSFWGIGMVFPGEVMIKL